jgi:hypothetical protein
MKPSWVLIIVDSESSCSKALVGRTAENREPSTHQHVFLPIDMAEGLKPSTVKVSRILPGYHCRSSCGPLP